jgi:peptide deformylase
MLATMRGATGVGLAAPQIGAPQRVLVAEVGRRVVALVNPRLRRKRGSQIGLEGCLSIPGIYADVRRAQDVVVDGLNALGRRITVRGAGLLARVLQHEIDHLNGVLFIDRIAPSRIIEHPLDRLRVARRRRAAVRPAPERVGIVPAVAARRYRRMVRT